MHTIRRILPHEVDDAIKLSEYAFRYTLEGEKRKQRESFMSDHIIFGVFSKGQMIAKTHVIPLSVVVDCQEYSMGGVASVATYPEHRRKGIANSLMDSVLLTMRNEGQILSFLSPFDIAFYRRYGYELTSSSKRITVLKRDFNFYKDISGSVVRLRGFDSVAELNQVYRQYIGRYNGMLVRGEKWWKDTRYEYCTPALYYNATGEPRGYIFYRVNGSTLEVQEYVYLDEESRRGLWNFIANHDSMVEKAEILTTEHEAMPFIFSNPSVKTELIPDFMGRVVLVKEFLERYVPSVPEGFDLALAVEDARAPWNTGLYTISSRGVEFKALHPETPENSQGQGPHLSMDINTFSALFLGSQRADFLHDSGRILGSREALKALGKVLSPRKCAFLDIF